MIYLKIQTNRAKLKELLIKFTENLQSDEKFIAPRPLPRRNFRFYLGYASVIENSRNHQLLLKIKNHSTLDNKTYQACIDGIEYSWNSPDCA